MAKIDTRVPLDPDVLTQVDDLARSQGRTREQVIEDSVRRTLAARSFSAVLDRVDDTAGLSENDAAALVYSEIRAARADRRLPTRAVGEGSAEGL